MLGIDHQHGKRGKTQPGADPGLSARQRRGALPSAQPAGVVRVGEPDLAPAGLWAPQTRGQRVGTAVSGQDDWIEAGAGGAADSVLPARRGSEAATVPAASISTSLHAHRHRTAGPGGRGARDLERAGHAEDSGARAA